MEPNPITASRSFWLLALFALALGLCVSWMWPTPSTPPAGIDLRAMLQEVPCGAGHESAAARARSAELDAEAQEARYAFAPETGRLAWALWSEARHCHALVGAAAAVERAKARADGLRVAMERDLRASRLRLDWALATRDQAQAARQAQILLARVPRSETAYRRWLRSIEAAKEPAP